MQYNFRFTLAILSLAAASAITACSPYDIPQPTFIGQQRGYSITGYVGTANEGIARSKVADRLRIACPHGVDFVDFKTTRADAAIGTKIMRYEAIATCKIPLDSSQ